MDVETQAQTAAAFKDYLIELSLSIELADATLTRYKQCLGHFQEYLEGRPPSPVTARLFLADLKQKGRKLATIQLHYYVLKPFLHYLGTPLTMKFRKPRRLPRYHSTEELRSILQVIDNRTDAWAKRVRERDRLMVLMLAFTGMRRSELLNLRRCDIAGNRIFVRSGKGDKDRVIPLSRQLAGPLKDYIERRNIGRTQKLFAVGPHRLCQIVKHYALAAGIENFTPHSLRHYFATALGERGAQLRAVQELLGHADISTTAIYLDVVPTHLESSIALLDDE